MSMSNLVIKTIGTGAVTGQMSSSLGVTQGGEMTTAMFKGVTPAIQPAMKIKSTTMVVKSVGKLKKKSKSFY